MSEKVLNIAIVLNIVPSYREGFYDILLARDDLDVKVYAQTHIPGLKLNLIHARYPDHVHLVKFFGAKREKVVWQCLPFYSLFTKYDLVIVDGNPRQLSHMVLATLLRFSGKKVVLWTMAHSFRGISLTENIRLVWTRIFKYIFVYTDAEVEFLREKGFKKQFIIGMNNGLNQRKIDDLVSDWSPSKLEKWRDGNNLKGKLLLLSCARLDPKNKFDLIVHALPIMVEKYPNLIWCIIGKGVEEVRLRELVNEKGLMNHVRFLGEIYDESLLSPWFLSSEILIHPAAVGLSLLHSFGYGLPVITNGNKALHGPEYAAFESGKTGSNYIENNFNDLASVTIKLLEDSDGRNRMKSHTRKIVHEQYNSEIMIQRFMEIVNEAAKN